ncbi:MAG: methyltransferase domain-containing protein [Gammaproteobacteria bacterium]
MKQKIVQCFNRGAKTYDSAAIVQMKIAEQLAVHLSHSPVEDILEIGCGTGLFSQLLQMRFPQASLLLSDIAPEMIEVCKNRFSESDRIDFMCQDGEALKLTKDYDLIASNMTLHWFNNIQKGLDNIIAKLKPNGKLVFAILGENSLIEWREMCEKLRIPVPTPHFPAREYLQKAFPKMQFNVETFQHRYASIYDFLKSLKNIGAVATQENYICLPAGTLRGLFRKYPNEIAVSYEVIYGSYLNS